MQGFPFRPRRATEAPSVVFNNLEVIEESNNNRQPNRSTRATQKE
jgi:hypothetical protein